MARQQRHVRHAGAGHAHVHAERHAGAVHGHRHGHLHHPTTTATTTNTTPTATMTNGTTNNASASTNTSATSTSTPTTNTKKPPPGGGAGGDPTWNGSVSNLWSNANNWTPNTAAPGAADTATFSGSSASVNGNTTISLNNQSILNILFDTASAAAYTLGSGAVGNETLSLSNLGTVVVNSTVSNDQLFNATLKLGSGTTATSFTFTNNSTTNKLTFAGAINTKPTNNNNPSWTLNLNGAGNGTISGVISGTGAGNGTNAQALLSLTKSGTGTWTLSGANTYAGATTVNAGMLSLDHTAAGAPATNIINNSANSSSLILGGGTFSISGSGSGASSDRVNGLTLNPGASTITLNDQGNGTLLTLGGITRTTGSTIRFNLSGTQSGTNGITTTSSNDANGLLGAGMIATTNSNGNDWATKSGSNIIAFSGYTFQSNAASWTSNQNITNTNTSTAFSGTVGSNLTINSLRFNSNNAGGPTIGSGVTLTVLDGILITSTVGTSGGGKAETISGGSLRGSSGGDLVVINNGANGSTLTISSNIVDNTSATAFTKSGAGLVTLSGASNTYTGATYVNQGTLAAGVATTAFGINSAVVISTGATLDITGFNETIGSLASNNVSTGGTGSVVLGAATLTTGGNGTSTTFGGVISGTGGSVIKTGSGTQTLTGANTYSGTTNINVGKLSLDSAGSTTARLTSTSTINVNSGGTLLLANSSATTSTDRIGNSVPVTVNGGGTFNTGGLSEGTRPSSPSANDGAAGMGALTLAGTSGSHSTIDFGSTTAGSSLVFSSLTAGSKGAFVDILNWGGLPNTDNGTATFDRLLFANDPLFTTTDLQNFAFSGFATGAREIMYGSNMWEIVPLPEPSTWVAGALALTSLVACRAGVIRRRACHAGAMRRRVGQRRRISRLVRRR